MTGGMCVAITHIQGDQMLENTEPKCHYQEVL